MVCGAAWWTCGCTERQLEEVKRRARRGAGRRRAREEKEEREALELHRALEGIARLEAEEAEKAERARATREARRKGRVASRFADLGLLLGEVNEFQRGVLLGQHERGRMEMLLQVQTAEEGRNRRHVTRIEELRTASRRKMDEKEKELWEEYNVGHPRETPQCTVDMGTEVRPEEGGAPDERDGEANEQ